MKIRKLLEQTIENYYSFGYAFESKLAELILIIQIKANQILRRKGRLKS